MELFLDEKALNVCNFYSIVCLLITERKVVSQENERFSLSCPVGTYVQCIVPASWTVFLFALTWH